MSDPVLLERRGAVLVITLNRREAYNAFDRRQAVALAGAVASFENDPSLRAAVVTGAGGHFSSGTDLKASLAGESVVVAPGGYYGMLEAPPSKPVVAAVEGYALGGGFELALACDLIVAADTAVFGLPEVRVGVVACAGGLFRLPRRIPYHHAMELALTGRRVGVADLDRWGLVNRIVPEGAALDAAVALAEEVCANAPVAVAVSKEAVRRCDGRTDGEAWEIQRSLQPRIDASQDMREGIAAFKEKRAPVWAGR